MPSQLNPSEKEIDMTTQIQTVLMTGKTHTTASRREGTPRGDERVDIQMSTPGKAGNEIVLEFVEQPRRRRQNDPDTGMSWPNRCTGHL